MTSPAPQPAPLRPGQRAALALLDKPGAYATDAVYIYIHCRKGYVLKRVDGRAFWPLMNRNFITASRLYEYQPIGERYTITPAGRAALRAGSRGGRGRRR